MNDNPSKPNFDWVSARSRCSLMQVFETLKLQVQEDVDIRTKLRPALAEYGFKFLPNADRFTVYLEANRPHWSVVFTLTDKQIEVRDQDNNLLIEATVTLNDEGECRLRVKGEEREFWQVRKMALERLFYSV
jgi:hypothetical protein